MSLIHAGTSPKLILWGKTHLHPCYEIILNTDGEGISTVGEMKIPFSPGTILIIPPNTPHTKRAKDGFRDIYVLADSIYPLPIYDDIANGFALDENVDGELFALAKMILCRYVENNKKDPALIRMYELFMQLLAEKCGDSQLDPIVEDIRRQLTMRFNEPELSLSSILVASGYNKDHIRRRFISAYGATPVEYLTRLRIDYAKNLLKNRHELDASISEIGTMCGYYDAHYFSRVFKKYVGVSPNEYSP